ncbi:MAG: PepSY domain-containing protein [Sphingomonadaceae bacterium]
MNQRTAFIVSGAITAFLLVLVGALATYVGQANGLGTSVASAVSAEATSQPDQVATLTPDREAAYREALDLANERLRQAADQISRANAQIEQQRYHAPEPAQPAAGRPLAPPAAVDGRSTAAPAAPAEVATPAAPPYPVSADAAASTALSVAPGARVQGTPELISFQGAVAYEVVLDRGTVYVDATTGRVLYNGAEPALLASASNGRSDDDEDEHEDDDREDEDHEDEDHEREGRRAEVRGGSPPTAASSSRAPRLRVEAHDEEDDDD